MNAHEAAALLGVSRYTLKQYVREGLVVCTDGEYDEAQLVDLLRTAPHPGLDAS